MGWDYPPLTRRSSFLLGFAFGQLLLGPPYHDLRLPNSPDSQIGATAFWQCSSVAMIKGEGWRWTDPGNQGNGVRIDRGDPNNSQPTQQQDHVVVRSGGRVIRHDGRPIDGLLAQNAERAHIALSGYQGWTTWDHP